MYSLSVIVPVYNAEKYLSRALESLRAQTIAESMQIILIDDGSSDASPALCDDFASRRSDTVVIHRKNGGVSAARNAGIKEASGEYIGFIDADDTVAPDYFEKLLNAAKENRCDMAFGDFILIYNGEHRASKSDFQKNDVFSHKQLIDEVARKMLSCGQYNSVWSKIFSHSVIDENNITFPVGVKIGEDKRFVLEYMRHCERAVYTGDNGYYYFDIPSSAMHSDKIINELLNTYDDETKIFVSLGLDEETVKTEKSAFLFYSLADFLQRIYSQNKKEARKKIKQFFSNANLMEKMDCAADYIKANNGRIYTMLATAFSKRSTLMTQAVLFVQKLINERKF